MMLNPSFTAGEIHITATHKNQKRIVPPNVNPGLINPGWSIVVVPPNSDNHGYWNGTPPQLNSRLGLVYSSRVDINHYW